MTLNQRSYEVDVLGAFPTFLLLLVLLLAALGIVAHVAVG